jgi:hypothetical protein
MSYFDDNEDRITGLKKSTTYQGVGKQMTEYDNTNRGVLFINNRKEKEKQPDRKGEINIDGKEYWLSGWTKSKGVISMSVQPKEQQSNEQDLDDVLGDMDSIPF